MLHGVLFSSAFTTCNYFSHLIASLTSSKLLLSNKHAHQGSHTGAAAQKATNIQCNPDRCYRTLPWPTVLHLLLVMTSLL
jgi:hypothetical protein